MLRDPEAAEEIAAQAVAQVAERIIQGYGPGAKNATSYWKGLLGLIAHGLAVDEYRHRQREIPSGPAVVLPDTPARAGFRADFDQAVRDLPPPERDAFILTELRGLSVREAADVMGASKSTVSRLEQTARTFVRKELT